MSWNTDWPRAARFDLMAQLEAEAEMLRAEIERMRALARDAIHGSCVCEGCDTLREIIEPGGLSATRGED